MPRSSVPLATATAPRTSSSTSPRRAAPAPPARGYALELGLDAGVPQLGAIGEPAVVGLHPAAGDQDAQIGAVVAVLADAVDAQVERLLLVADAGDLGGAADEADIAVAVHAPDARGRRLGDQLDLVLGLLEDQLAPGVVVGPARLHLGEVELPVDVHELEQVEQEQRAAAIGAW